MQEPCAILVVDDDEGCRRAVARLLATAGYRVTAVGSVAAALDAIDHATLDAVLTELRLPDGDGVGVLDRVRQAKPFAARVMLTGVVDFLAVQDAVNRGAVHAFFTKPWDNESLLQGVRGALEQVRLARENAEMSARLADQNRVLEALVVERTHALERAKQELQAVFDVEADPLALVTGEYAVVRANRAWAREAGLDVREVPGRTCHEALFRESHPCEGCPVPSARRSGSAAVAVVQRRFRVQARPVEVRDRLGLVLCRYSASDEAG